MSRDGVLIMGGTLTINFPAGRGGWWGSTLLGPEGMSIHCWWVALGREVVVVRCRRRTARGQAPGGVVVVGSR
jgi:hypothetical protein